VLFELEDIQTTIQCCPHGSVACGDVTAPACCQGNCVDSECSSCASTLVDRMPAPCLQFQVLGVLEICDTRAGS
jgi:hypothetical protein